MDFTRLSLAAVVAWFVCMTYGIAVQMLILGDQFVKYPAIFRSEAAINANVPLMLAGSLLAMFALACIYAKAYQGGHGTLEGIGFGVLVALFTFGFASVGIYGSINVGRRLAVVASVTSFIEMILVGAVIGTLYKPTPRPEARALKSETGPEGFSPMSKSIARNA